MKNKFTKVKKNYLVHCISFLWRPIKIWVCANDKLYCPNFFHGILCGLLLNIHVNVLQIQITELHLWKMHELINCLCLGTSNMDNMVFNAYSADMHITFSISFILKGPTGGVILYEKDLAGAWSSLCQCLVLWCIYCCFID